jgi:hypothetical protein
MEQMNLAEAYRRRDSIAEAGQAIYCKGRTGKTIRRIIFHARQPGGVWFNVWLVVDEEASLVAMHADALVFTAEAPGGPLRIVPREGRYLVEPVTP